MQILGLDINIGFGGDKIKAARKEIDIGPVTKPIVNSRASVKRELPFPNELTGLSKSLRTVTPEFQFDVIPILRKLSKINPDVSQAMNDFVRLANTGHKINFDPSVPADQVDKMRAYLKDASSTWHAGAAGVDGIVNKMFRQIMIGGALSTEWIPNMALNQIDQIRFLEPENVRFVVNKGARTYKPYQKLKNMGLGIIGADKDLKKLNTNQYKYIALNGDLDNPYGIPPYMAVIDPIATQTSMVDNIKNIINMLGILGYLDAKIAKPDMMENETEPAYEARLIQFLTETKERVLEGFADGANVGFIDDHEFDFKATVKSAEGVQGLFEQNELAIASALQYDAIFMGRPGASETLVTVMFTKMLAQLTNVQNIIIQNLEFGYKLALSLAGFSFKDLNVVFKRSTIQDDLKYQQAQEIMVRNQIVKYQYGIIGLEQWADELGYVKPDKKEPRIDINTQDPSGDAAAKKKKEEGKDTSERKTTDKNNTQGTVKKRSNK